MENIVTSGDISSAVVDFSLLSLFLKADLVVKSVIIILIAASIYSWAVIVEKLVKMKKLKQLENEFDEIFGLEILLKIYMRPLIIIKTILNQKYFVQQIVNRKKVIKCEIGQQVQT